MIDDDTLSNAALAEASRLASNLLEGELAITLGASQNGWDAHLRRHVFLQPTVVWRRYGEVSISLDAQGRVRAFQDRNRLLNSLYFFLEPAEVLRIAGATGLVGARARVVQSVPAAQGLLEAIIEQRHHVLPPRLRVVINPTLRLVAELEVL